MFFLQNGIENIVIRNSGVVQAQIDYTTKKIQKTAKHFQCHQKDKHSKVGLLKIINLRKRLIRYLNRKKDKI